MALHLFLAGDVIWQKRSWSWIRGDVQGAMPGESTNHSHPAPTVGSGLGFCSQMSINQGLSTRSKETIHPQTTNLIPSVIRIRQLGNLLPLLDHGQLILNPLPNNLKGITPQRQSRRDIPPLANPLSGKDINNNPSTLIHIPQLFPIELVQRPLIPSHRSRRIDIQRPLSDNPPLLPANGQELGPRVPGLDAADRDPERLEFFPQPVGEVGYGCFGRAVMRYGGARSVGA